MKGTALATGAGKPGSCALLAQPFLPYWIIQFLSAPSSPGTDSSPPSPLPTGGPNAGSLQMLYSTDSAGPSAPTQGPFSFPQVICIMVPNPDCQGTLLGLLQPFNSLGYMNFSLLTLSVEYMGWRY